MGLVAQPLQLALQQCHGPVKTLAGLLGRGEASVTERLDLRQERGEVTMERRFSAFQPRQSLVAHPLEVGLQGGKGLVGAGVERRHLPLQLGEGTIGEQFQTAAGSQERAPQVAELGSRLIVARLEMPAQLAEGSRQRSLVRPELVK